MYEAPELAKGWRFKIRPGSNRGTLVVKIQQKFCGIWFTFAKAYAFDGMHGYEREVTEACHKVMNESGYNDEQKQKEYIR